MTQKCFATNLECSYFYKSRGNETATVAFESVNKLTAAQICLSENLQAMLSSGRLEYIPLVQ